MEKLKHRKSRQRWKDANLESWKDAKMENLGRFFAISRVVCGRLFEDLGGDWGGGGIDIRVSRDFGTEMMGCLNGGGVRGCGGKNVNGNGNVNWGLALDSASLFEYEDEEGMKRITQEKLRLEKKVEETVDERG
ncbi:predicted protein [Sclerotinia sclerotiorum 1980 UF-70]|uniref:Uncharacterized protein n=1 Tax=Sclerotinia sclerotiorum (strain ATCC 18683 / 1980 / Ss-1) TaxID=665079 RepID=A7E796_SCLS1|nr:predicted protein [Sclerotinia sclerotiorum 1980 UF-70]EDN96248.1 predicted protein [Sclerotinia sclerotiorum 1980 UF-70]